MTTLLEPAMARTDDLDGSGHPRPDHHGTTDHHRATGHRGAPARRTQPAGVTLYLLASIVIVLLAASSAPTPLYATYQTQCGFSPITVTVVFGIYALAVLATLLTVGRLSDHVGRRPLLLGAIVAQLISLVIFTTAAGLGELIAARVVQGLSTGAALGAVGAGLIDVDKIKGPIANVVAPMAGVGLGALLSGVLVQFLPQPTRLVYLVLIVVFAVQFAGVLFMRETVTRKPGALATLRPEIALPKASRRPMLVSAPVLVSAWSLGGFYSSLGPSLVRKVTGSDSTLLGGLALTVLAVSAAIAVLMLRNASAGG
jgi:MFS family permease